MPLKAAAKKEQWGEHVIISLITAQNSAGFAKEKNKTHALIR